MHRIVLDELEDDFDEMPILQTPISSMPPPLNPRAQTMNRASDIATSISKLPLPITYDVTKSFTHNVHCHQSSNTVVCYAKFD